MEDSTIITIVTVVCSSLVTLLSGVASILYAAYKTRFDEQTFYERRKIETLEKYFEGVFGSERSAESREFHKIGGIVYLYIPPDQWELLDRIYAAKDRNDANEAHELARQLLDSISRKDLKKLSIRIKKHENRTHTDRDD